MQTWRCSVFDRIITVCAVGAAAIAISHLTGPMLHSIQREYELQSNTAFNNTLIQKAIKERQKNGVGI